MTARVESHENGPSGRAARRPGRQGRASPLPTATKASVERVLQLVAEYAPLEDVLEGANRISNLTESCEVFPVTLNTSGKLAKVDIADVRFSAEQHQPPGPLRSALDEGRIAHIGVNNRRDVTYFCADPELRSALKGAKVVLCGLHFKFPEGDPLMGTFFFDVFGFNVKFSTRELSSALYAEKYKPIAIYHSSPNAGSKLAPTSIRVDVASREIPEFLLVNGEAIYQLRFQGNYFPVRCRGMPNGKLTDAFRQQSHHCLVLHSAGTARTSSTPSSQCADPSRSSASAATNDRGTTNAAVGAIADDEAANDDASMTDMRSEPEGEKPHQVHDHDADEAMPTEANPLPNTRDNAAERTEDDGNRPPTMDTNDDARSEASMSSELASDNASEKSHDGLHDLSVSMIDIDSCLLPQTSGQSVLDMLEPSFTEEAFVSVQRRTKRHKRNDASAVASSPVNVFATANPFEALDDLKVDIEVVEWTLTSIAEQVPYRVAIKPKVQLPESVSPRAKRYTVPSVVKDETTSTLEVVYGESTPLSKICDDIGERLHASTARSLDEQSGAAMRKAMSARFALKNYADPSVLVGDNAAEPLAHVFAFTTEIQQNPYSMNNVIRLHAIQRCLAATDGSTIRRFRARASDLLSLKAPYERSSILMRFEQLQTQTDDIANLRCLYYNDTLALFELLFMMIAPDFFSSSTRLMAYLKTPVKWLPCLPLQLLHPDTLIDTLATPLAKYIVEYIASIQPLNEGVSRLVAMQADTRHIVEHDGADRYMVLQLVWENQQGFVHNVYEPVAATPIFFSQLPTTFPDDAIHIIGGDFNTVLDPTLDSVSYLSHQIAGAQALGVWLSSLDVVDPWRIHHPNDRVFTSPHRKNCLDFIMLSLVLNDLYYRSAEYSDVVFGSDYLSAIVRLLSSTEVVKSAVWRLKASTIDVPSAREWLIQELQELADNIDVTRNPGLVYQSWKRRIRTIMRQRDQFMATAAAVSEAEDKLQRLRVSFPDMNDAKITAAEAYAEQARERHNQYQCSRRRSIAVF